jgi:hypothetical protein
MTDKPKNYNQDNGLGQPTHLKRQDKWIETPKGYHRREDSLISHVYIRVDGELGWVSVPTQEELEEMADGIAETPEGDYVEPDHPRSWLVLLGFI